MFAGLLLASLSAAVAHTALFQRKARAGWLDELDDIRASSLDRPEGSIEDVVEGDGIWTDLREGGQYDDPHEISSLYADDDRPGRTSARGAARPAAARGQAPASPEAEPEPAPPRATEPEVAPLVEVDADIWTQTERLAPPVASHESDQLWAQPAPHPMRPSEMWHPAELEPMPVNLDPGGSEPAAAPAPAVAPAPAATIDDEATRLGAEIAAELVADAVEPVGREVADALESELLASADVAVLEPVGHQVDWAEPLATAPVGRRQRRDRPVLPGAASDRPAVEPLPTRGDRSPLPEAPLPSAVPAPVIDPTPTVVPDLAAARAPAPEADPAPVADPAPAAAPVEPVVAPAAVQELAVGADGMVPVPGTIVRLGGARRAAAAADRASTKVALDEGWCWVAPGAAMVAPVVVDLPAVTLTVEPGATILTVVESDRSCFIVVADGSGQLRRGEESGPLGRGAIVMVDPTGWAQIDRASDEEIVADPLVAENLALDAEL